MKEKTLFLLVFVLVLVAGCEGVDVGKLSDEDLARISEKAVVCNSPYIRFGTSCCLDQNINEPKAPREYRKK